MRFLPLLTLLIAFNISFIQHSKAQQIEIGVSMYLDYNLYHWYKQPITYSTEQTLTGQMFNLIPLGGLGLWVGQKNNFRIAIEGGINYMPFSFNINNYKGLGATSFPLLLRITQPFIPGAEVSPFIGIGVGWQWNRINLYARPENSIASYFQTRVLEFNLGIGHGWGAKDKQLGVLAFYARAGNSSRKSFTLDIGLRASLMLKLTPSTPTQELPKERLYQAESKKLWYF